MNQGEYHEDSDEVFGWSAGFGGKNGFIDTHEAFWCPDDGSGVPPPEPTIEERLLAPDDQDLNWKSSDLSLPWPDRPVWFCTKSTTPKVWRGSYDPAMNMFTSDPELACVQVGVHTAFWAYVPDGATKEPIKPHIN